MSTERRYELPPGLSPQEEEAVLAALERYLAEEPPPNPWVTAGRNEAAGAGVLQTRRQGPGGWRRAVREPFARRGAPTLHGRGDAS